MKVLGGPRYPSGLFFVLQCRDLLPAVALVRARREAALDLGQHHDIAMAQLARDEFVGRVGADRSDREKMPRGMQPMRRKAEHAEPLGVNVARLTRPDRAE